MPATDPELSRPRLIRDASFLAADWEEITQRRGPHNRLGFAYQIAFVRVVGRFPRQAPLEINAEIPRFTALQLRMAPETIQTYAHRRQTVSEHQQCIRDYLGLCPFDGTARDQLVRFLENEALRLDRSAALLARGHTWLREHRLVAPAGSVLRRAVGTARQKARAGLMQRMMACLSSAIRDRLDALVVIAEDAPFSALNRIKTSPARPSPRWLRNRDRCSRNRSLVGWHNRAMTGFYTYPEHTPSSGASGAGTKASGASMGRVRRPVARPSR